MKSYGGSLWETSARAGVYIRAGAAPGRRKCNRIYIVFLSVSGVILVCGEKRDGGATHERGWKREGGATHGSCLPATAEAGAAGGCRAHQTPAPARGRRLIRGGPPPDLPRISPGSAPEKCCRLRAGKRRRRPPRGAFAVCVPSYFLIYSPLGPGPGP